MSGETTFTRGKTTVTGRWNTPSAKAAAQFAQVWVDLFETPRAATHHAATKRTRGDNP